MSQIPVVIVDDEKVDRLVARRRFNEEEKFGDVFESETGDAFLEEFFNGHDHRLKGAKNAALILMDVNMPGRNGFETIEEMEARLKQGRGPKGVTVVVFTSSNNPADRARADTLETVKGYITKPLEKTDVEQLLQLYHA